MNPIEEDGPLPLFREDAGWEAVHAVLSMRGLSDGLPQVPPTARRMEWMLAGVADAERSYGMLPPMFGELTPAAVAYCCVLAGCLPPELPVVLAAAEACIEPDFNLLGLLTTTGTPAIATVVHGPIVQQLDMNDGTNCLGPGNRANAAIGRAVSLLMRIIAGAVEQTGDMATMGQPGKYAFCFAESRNGLLPSLAERRGIAQGASAVTVLGASGTMEVLPLGERNTAEAILLPVAAALIAAGAAASGGKQRALGEQVVLLPPEITAALQGQGLGVAEIQEFLVEAIAIDIPGVASIVSKGGMAASASDIIPIETGGPGAKMTCLPLWSGGTRTQTRCIRELGA
jgi:hypothetical protein